MKFCPKCRSLLVPSGEKLKCRNPRCDYEEQMGGEVEVIHHEAGEEKEIVIIEEDLDTLPTTAVRCPKCGNDKAYWWMRQLRGTDEPETRFFRCTKCGNTWRETA